MYSEDNMAQNIINKKPIFEMTESGETKWR